ncbi:DUF5107 domain-containing protein [Parapedobacter koreensis]|uniref:DUF5107 domain-containing protein n=1 Tax=Parapedobacter koreensis TaxID=332977 RepID=A0A1H7SN82_9SPHI|nr:DUF5107 domain-containing protein [Parapedobacter koreensis]SEL72917.1 protein of unknown function [Parapedobacter koreensis]
MNTGVTIWTESISLPTYPSGKPEKNPMFLEKRVYQGSSGVVYPYPVIEKIEDEKVDQQYQALFLENDYVKIMILPELGGRVQMAYDKIRQRHFIYYNQVVKPALVGLTGPWISGGIEFNWPQHHRPSTFLPVDYTIQEHANGAKTIWVNEVEIMFRTKGMAGFTLYPDKAYLEIEARLSNRTPFPQTFLWWANPAVKVNDHYQSIFPPDVHAVFDHGKRDVSSFPIATGTYYKMDYSPGTDISKYKNIPVPTSFMAVGSKYDFMGGYEHDVKAGVLHVANHHTVPGKKQWTWGNADFGQAWDRNLTDADGPYIELMTGAYTDNQPDFSWLQPNEAKNFVQYFMPYAEIGMVKNASKDFALNLEMQDGKLVIGIYATGTFPEAHICLTKKGSTYWSETTTLSPANAYVKQIDTVPSDVPEWDQYALEVYDEEGNLLLAYQPEKHEEKELPDPATPAPPPTEVGTTEELYLHGLHLEQYRHATFDPLAYYQEALRRDSGDLRNNNAIGLWLLRRGAFDEAEAHFRTALARLTMRNTNPYDGEVLYNLAYTRFYNEAWAEAYDLFYKAAWNAAWKDSAYLMLGRIDLHLQRYEWALRHIAESLVRNAHSSQALHLRLVALRKLQRYDEALALAAAALDLDPFNYGVYVECYLLHETCGSVESATQAKHTAIGLMQDRTATYIEYALDYDCAGCYEEALLFLDWAAEDDRQAQHPLLHYHLGYLHTKVGNAEKATAAYQRAAACPPDFCFPNRVEDMLALEAALQDQPQDAKAYHYLGNYWYGKRMHDKGIRAWEQSTARDPHYPTAKRNLALAYYNKKQDYQEAKRLLEEAFNLDTTDARILMELDQLYKLQQISPQERLAKLDQLPALVAERDDLYLERITLLNWLGRYQEAFQLLTARNFHPWEGGEGKVTGQYLIAGTALAKQALLDNQPMEALQQLQSLQHYPHNLGEGKLPNAPENDLHYLMATAFERMGDGVNAANHLREATKGDDEPVQAIFYNDPQPDQIFYQGLAWRKLGNIEKAAEIFQKLHDFGTRHMDDKIAIDYMAVSLPDLLVFEQDLSAKNRIHCLYMIGLATLGKADYQQAKRLFEEVLGLNNSHMGAQVHLEMIGFLQQIEALNV